MGAKEGGNAVEQTHSEVIAKGGEDRFDASAAPPFNFADLRSAIPAHCWEKNVWRSMSFMIVDVAVVTGLAVGANYIDSWLVWPAYWIAQGWMFWALFNIGHDCGHGCFSNNKQINDAVGHLTHSLILVPFHGWRVSHRTHHANTGHADNDESWFPPTEVLLRDYPLRIQFPLILLVWPYYLYNRGVGRSGSHFNPGSVLFNGISSNEKTEVVVSTAIWSAMFAALLSSTLLWPLWTLQIYWAPYVLFAVLLDVVTYLHHHGYNKEKIPWYRGQEWTHLRGALSTIDRDYGWLSKVHHDVGTHIVHHLFPQIPHYHLVEATEAVKPVLGKYYRQPQKSGPIPIHLVYDLINSFKEEHFVDDKADIVFYQKRDKTKAL